MERLTQLEYVFFNGDQEHRYPGCINASFAYVEGESLLMALKVYLFLSLFFFKNVRILH